MGPPAKIDEFTLAIKTKARVFLQLIINVLDLVLLLEIID